MRAVVTAWSSPLDPIRLAERGARLSGELPIQGLSRLAAMCASEPGVAQLDLTFEHAAGAGFRRMHGTVTANVRLVCQRCLEEMALTLRIEPNIVLLRSDERHDLAGANDVLVVGKRTSLGDMLEDELLLALPMTPTHNAKKCPAPATSSPSTSRQSESVFSTLQGIKRGRDK